MKHIYVTLVAIICFSLSISAQSTCDYRLEITDNFGTEWDSGPNLAVNAGVDVTVDGVTMTYLVMNNGPVPNQPYTETYTITVDNGDAISIDYRPPALAGDGQFELYDSEGILVYASPFNQPAAMNIFTGTASCPTCPVVNNLSVSNIQAFQADLAWTNGGSETQWEIEYGVSPYTVGTGGTIRPAGTNPFTLDMLMSDTSYDVYVRAVCTPGTDISNSQGPITFMTTESCPAPSSFVPVTQTTNSISFAWDNNGNVSPNFEVNYGPTPYNLNDPSGTTRSFATGLFADVDGLMSDTEYSFYVRYDCGNGDFSSWEGPYTARTLISCPVVGALQTTNITATSIDIDWTPGGNESEWEVEYAPVGTITNPFTNQGTLLVPNPTTPMASIPSLTDATEYDIYVRAVCDPVQPDYSAPLGIQATTLCLPFTPTSASPYVEDFENFTPATGFSEQLCWSATSADAYDWNLDGSGGTPSSGTGPLGAFSGTNFFYVEASSGTAGSSTAILNSPQFDLSGLTDPSVQFYYHMFGDEMGDLFVEVDDLSGSGWTTLTTISGPQQANQADPYLLQIVNLSAYANQTVRIRFRAVSAGTFEGDISIDDVAVTDLPPCADPNRLSVDNVLDTSAELVWSENGIATTWQVEVLPTGVAQGTVGAAVYENPTATNPETATGLMPETTYDYYVRSDCGANGFSTWVGPFTFTTACAPIVAPYAEDFETFATTTSFTEENCWEATSDSAWDWNLDGAGGTPTGNTGPDGANSGTNYFYIEGSSGSQGDEAILLSPIVDLSGLTAPSLQFASHMFGTATGILHVDVNDGSGFVNDVLVLTGEQQSSSAAPYDVQVVDLSAYAGTSVQVRFRAERTETAFTGTSDIAIDDVVFDEFPACPQPTAITVGVVTDTTAEIAWTENGSATAWNIEYGPCGFTPGDGTSTTVPVTTNPFTLNSLSAFTCYDFYVVADCSGTLSAASGPGTFTTECAAFAAPFFENFETFSTTTSFVEENCWEGMANTSFDWNVDGAGSTPSSGTGPSSAFSGSNYFYTEASGAGVGDEAELISPLIDITALTTPSVQFKYHMFGGEIGTLHIDVNDGTGWINDVGTIGPGQQQTAQSDDWLDGLVDLQPLTLASNVIQVRFRAESNGSFEGDISLDDFRVDDIPTCPSIIGLTQGVVNSSSVELNWTAGGTEAEWLVEYREVGTTAFTALSPNPTSPTATVPGLASGTQYEFCVSAICAPGDVSQETCLLVETSPDYCAGDAFVDSGGVGGNYQNNENITYNICPDNPGDVVYVNFTFNDLEDSFAGCFDGLTIYDGPDTTFPTINTPGGDTEWCWDPANNSGTGNLVGELLIGTSTSGCLTFVFSSDGSVQRPGWEANVTCAPPPTCDAPSMLATTATTDTTADLEWVAGGTETEWDVEVGLPGFTPDTMTSAIPVINVTTNPMTTATGLMPDTDYEYYVRAVCGPGDTSVFIGPFSFTTACAPVVAPYLEDFETFATVTGFTEGGCWTASAIDAYDWNVDGAGSTPSTGTGPTGANSGSNYFYIEASSGTSGVSTATLVTPLIDLSTLTSPSVSFFYHMFGGEIGTLDLEINDGSGWTNVVTLGPGQIQTAQGDAWLEQLSSIASYAGSTVQFRFIAVSAGTFEGDISIDDFKVDELPACPNPGILTAENITDTTADLGWTENGVATVWNVEYGPCGFTPGGTDPNATVVTGTTMNPLPIAGLTPQTCYEFYVTSDCGNGDFSNQIGPFAFETACAAIVAPYVEGFEMFTVTTSFQEENCWSTPQTSGYTWDVSTGGTGSLNTGPTAAASGANYFFTEASSGGTGDEAELYSPLIDISALTNPALTFSYHMAGDDFGTLHVDVNDGTGWTNDVFTVSGTQQLAQADPWLTNITGLGAFNGTIQIRFRGTRGPGFECDIAIDDVSVDDFNGCLAPSGLSVDNVSSSSAGISWSPGGSETLWEYVNQPAGTGVPTAAGTQTTAPNASISSLTASTSYEVYVRADCGMGNYSDWIGPITYQTSCAPFVAPYGMANGGPGNDFTTFPGACWEESDGTTIAAGPNGGDGEWTALPFANDATSPNGDAARINLWNNPNPDMDWLVTPEFDLGTGGNFDAYFDIALTAFGNTNTSDFGSDDEVQLLITSDGGVTWNNLVTWTNGSGISNTGQREVVDLSAYQGVVRMAFYATNGTVADAADIDFFVDNFSIDVTAGVDNPELLGFTYYPNPTADVVNIDAQNLIDTIQVTNLLGQQILQVAPNATSGSVDLTTMESGIYFLRVTAGDQTHTVKVVRE